MIQLWHGGNRWEGRPEIRPSKQGRYECGPGIYLTTHYDTARKYAKGGKVVTRVTLADDIRWIHRQKAPVQSLRDYVRSTSRFPRRADILADIDRAVERRSVNGAVTEFAVETLLNLAINRECLDGQQGVLFAHWLVEQGVDAMLHRAYGQEQWVVVFNPDIIRRFEVVPASAVNGDWDFPEIKLQDAA